MTGQVQIIRETDSIWTDKHQIVVETIRHSGGQHFVTITVGGKWGASGISLNRVQIRTLQHALDVAHDEILVREQEEYATHYRELDDEEIDRIHEADKLVADDKESKWEEEGE